MEILKLIELEAVSMCIEYCVMEHDDVMITLLN